MIKIVGIHQPNYLGHAGFFRKMALCDTFVIFDDAQLPRGGHYYETRAVIRGANGPIEMNIPVEHRGGELIKDTRLAPGRWKAKHFKSIALNYPKSERLTQLEEIYVREWKMLADFNVALIRLLATWLGIHSKIVLSSELGVHGSGAEKIIGIIKALGADTYISGMGTGSRRYVNEKVFSEEGITLAWHAYSGSNLSVIDSILLSDIRA